MRPAPATDAAEEAAPVAEKAAPAAAAVEAALAAEKGTLAGAEEGLAPARRPDDSDRGPVDAVRGPLDPVRGCADRRLNGGRMTLTEIRLMPSEVWAGYLRSRPPIILSLALAFDVLSLGHQVELKP